MKYKKKNLGSYNLHMIKTSKFKTVNIQVILSKEVKKEEITIRNFLTDMLTYSCNKYKTKRELSIAAQDLYAVNIYASNYRLGNYYNTDINLSLLEEKYTEEGMLIKSIELLKEILFNPNIENNDFDKESFNVIKNNMRIRIESLKEDPKKYSMIKMLANMDDKAPYSYHGFGYLEDLENITPETLYKYYKDFIDTSSIDIFIVGDIDFEKIEQYIRDNFKFNTFKKDKKSIVIKHDKFRTRAKKVIEVDKLNQSKLSIGCKIKDLTDFEKHYVLTIYNIILGGNSNSLFFQSIREKNSLCYYIGSSSNKVDNLLIISSGITASNFDKTISLIKKEMKNMTLGKFDDELIEKAKTHYASLIDEMDDYPSQIISSYYATDILGVDYPEVRKKKILEVTKENIMEVAKKIKIDTIFLLEGSDEDE